MKRIAKLAIVMTVFSVVSAFGQTRTEVEAKFGEPVKVYPVGGRVWMSPEYASDGQVCRMVFYPRRFSSTTTYLVNELLFEEFRSVIDTVVPVAIRGDQKEPFGNGHWNDSNGGRWADFVYKRVTITYIASLPRYTGPGMGEPVNLDLSDDEVSKRKEKTKPIKPDFSLYSGSTVEIVTVQWNDRKCPVKESQTLVEVWCGGDDNLTQGVCRALDSEFASTPDFVGSSGERPGTLIVSIPTNVNWKERGKKTEVFYTVEFKSTNGKELGTKKGACWENDFRTCATQIVRQAKIAARKLTANH
jgi:hypothetical protein